MPRAGPIWLFAFYGSRISPPRKGSVRVPVRLSSDQRPNCLLCHWPTPSNIAPFVSPRTMTPSVLLIAPLDGERHHILIRSGARLLEHEAFGSRCTGFRDYHTLHASPLFSLRIHAVNRHRLRSSHSKLLSQRNFTEICGREKGENKFSLLARRLP